MSLENLFSSRIFSNSSSMFFCVKPLRCHQVLCHVLLFLLQNRGCLTQEKIVAGCAKHFIVIADYRYVCGDGLMLLSKVTCVAIKVYTSSVHAFPGNPPIASCSTV